jgi:hypothetical protein
MSPPYDRPYVVVQFEQNEFVSHDPTDEMDEEITNATFRLIVLGFMLANKWLDDHTMTTIPYLLQQDMVSTSFTDRVWSK